MENYHFSYPEIAAGEPSKNDFFKCYSQAGFVVADHLLNKNEIDNLLGVYDEIVRKRVSNKSFPYASYLMPHFHEPKILSASQNKELIDCVEMLLKGSVYLIQTQLTYKPPGSEGFSIHQDNYYNRVKPPHAIISAWLALEDSDEENGGLCVYPSSHKSSLLPVKKDWGYLLRHSPWLTLSAIKHLAGKSRPENAGRHEIVERFSYTQLPSNYERLALKIDACAVVFIHGNLVHSSGKNYSACRFRRSLLMNFVLKGSKFNKGLLAKRRPFDVHRGVFVKYE